MRLFLAFVALISLALAAGAIWDDFWVQRPARAALQSTVTNWADAQKADTAAANARERQCTVAVQAAVRSGAAIARASRVATPPQPGEEQPMVGNDTLRDIVGQGR